MADYDWEDALELITNPVGTILGSLKDGLLSTEMKSLPPSQKGLTGNSAPTTVLDEILTGGLMSSQAQGYAKENVGQQREVFEDIVDAQKPYDVSGPAGSTVFDEDERTMISTLSPELRAVFEKLLGRALSGSDVAVDPFEAQRQLYEQQSSLLQPYEEARRARSRDIALSRGLDPELSSIGLGYTGSIEDDIARNRNELLASTFGQAQDLETAQRTREMADISGAMGVLGMLSDPTGYGIQAGGRSIGNVTGLSDALTALTDTKSASTASFGDAFGSLFGDSIGGFLKDLI